jgi:hypothetical protein
MNNTEQQQAIQLLNEVRRKLADEYIVLLYHAFAHRVVTQAGLAALFGRSQVAVSRLIKSQQAVPAPYLGTTPIYRLALSGEQRDALVAAISFTLTHGAELTSNERARLEDLVHTL